MAAEIIEIFPDNPDLKKIEAVVECLNDGGIIIYPTDTVYSMGCSAINAKAVEKLCRLKNVKPEQNRFSIVCESLKDVSKYAKVSNQAFRLMKQIFPGPFTILLPATGDLPKTLQTKRKEIGIRIPDHAVPLELIRMLGSPLITTSLKDDIDDIVEYPNEIEQIYDQNYQKVDLIISGSWCGVHPSTVVSCTDDADFKIIREGIGLIDL